MSELIRRQKKNKLLNLFQKSFTNEKHKYWILFCCRFTKGSDWVRVLSYFSIDNNNNSDDGDGYAFTTLFYAFFLTEIFWCITYDCVSDSIWINITYIQYSTSYEIQMINVISIELNELWMLESLTESK